GIVTHRDGDGKATARVPRELRAGRRAYPVLYPSQGWGGGVLHRPRVRLSARSWPRGALLDGNRGAERRTDRGQYLPDLRGNLRRQGRRRNRRAAGPLSLLSWSRSRPMALRCPELRWTPLSRALPWRRRRDPRGRARVHRIRPDPGGGSRPRPG